MKRRKVVTGEGVKARKMSVSSHWRIEDIQSDIALPNTHISRYVLVSDIVLKHSFA